MTPDVNTYLDQLRESVPEISVLEAHRGQQQGRGLLIDVRELDEMAAGSPPGALRLPKGTLEMNVGNRVPDRNTPLYLLCASGRRSLVAGHCLRMLGYAEVASVRGGFESWKQHGLPFARPKMLGAGARERFKRHLIIPEIGEEGQLKLLEARVLVVGAGGIGSPVALYLAAAGVGTIGLVDDDVVDRSNLQRQILHTDDSVGQPKVESARRRLLALHPDLEVRTYNERLTADNVDGIFADYDLVLDGTDNFTTRYLIGDACVKHGLANVHGSVFRFEGQVSTFWPDAPGGGGPCYRCAYPAPPPPEMAPSCAEAGVLGVLPGMVGMVCATEAIKLIAGFGDLLVGQLLVFDARDWAFDTYELFRRDDCPYCRHATGEYPEYTAYETACALG